MLFLLSSAMSSFLVLNCFIRLRARFKSYLLFIYLFIYLLIYLFIFLFIYSYLFLLIHRLLVLVLDMNYNAFPLFLVCCLMISISFIISTEEEALKSAPCSLSLDNIKQKGEVVKNQYRVGDAVGINGDMDEDEDEDDNKEVR